MEDEERGKGFLFGNEVKLITFSCGASSKSFSSDEFLVEGGSMDGAGIEGTLEGSL